jgi:hypothetical protein
LGSAHPSSKVAKMASSTALERGASDVKFLVS